MATSAEEVGAWAGAVAVIGGFFVAAFKWCRKMWRNFVGRFALSSRLDAVDGRIDLIEKASRAGVDDLRQEIAKTLAEQELRTAQAVEGVKGEVRTIKAEMARKDELEHVRGQVDRLVDHLLGHGESSH